MSTDRAELERVARLLNGVFAHADPLTPESLHWYYDENPVAAAAVGRVEDGDQRVGNYALVPQVFAEPGGQRRTLGVGVDLAVAPESRGAGTFRRTVEDACARGAAAGFDGILGVANANSAPRMVSTLGWRALEPLPVTLCPPVGRSGLVDHPVTTELLDGPVFERLTAGGFLLPDHHGYAPDWTPETLRWRLRRPGSPYWLHVSDDLLVVSTRTHISRVPFGVVLKVLARPGLRAAVPVGRVAAALARCHRTPFVVHWGRNPWMRVRGVRLPQSRMPSPLSLVLHSFHEGFAPASFELAGMEFLDFDAY